MHRVYVAWDMAEASRFLRVLRDHGITGKVIEDRDFPERGELHDAETTTEVWISDSTQVGRALELASDFEGRRQAVVKKAGEGTDASEGDGPGTDASEDDGPGTDA